MGEPIWKIGALIASEELTKRFQTDAEKWAKRVCICFGNTIPLNFSEVTSNQAIKLIVQKNITTLNTHYKCIQDGLEIPLPTNSRFSVEDAKEVQFHHRQQAILAQQLPWIKLALLQSSEVNNKIKHVVSTRLATCINDLYLLLENSEERSIQKCRLAALKSFLISQFCMFQIDGEKTNAITWEALLQLWVEKEIPPQHPIASRIQELKQYLCSISCLKKPPPEDESVTFNPITKRQEVPDCTSFRSFVALSTANYLENRFAIPQAAARRLCPIFETHECLRILVMYYCYRLFEIKKACKGVIDLFFSTAEQELGPMRSQLAKELYSKIDTYLLEYEFSGVLKSELQKRPTKISEFYKSTKAKIPAIAEPHFLELSALLDQFNTVEAFCECAELLCSHDIQTKQTTRVVPHWHPFTIFFAGSSEDRTTLKHVYHVSNDVDTAVYILYNLEVNYGFTIPNEKKLFLAIRCQQRKFMGVNISEIFGKYTVFSKIFSKQTTPVERLEFLLCHDIHHQAPPILSEYASNVGTTTSTEQEYLRAVDKALFDKYFLDLLDQIEDDLKINLTFDEIISVCRYGTRETFLLNGYGYYIASLPHFIEKLKKYEFSNVQQLLLALEFIRTKIVAGTHRTLDKIEENPSATVEKHRELLENLEKYLRLTLPKTLAFSWLVYHEMNESRISKLLVELTNLRDLESQKSETIQQLSECIFRYIPAMTVLSSLPEANVHYKTALVVFLLRSIYTMPVIESHDYIPQFFFPKTLPYPKYPIPAIFSSAAPDMDYPSHHLAYFSSWNKTSDGYFEYSLFMVKNPCLLESHSSTFRLEIPKKRLKELSLEQSFAYPFLRQMFSYFLSDMSVLAKYCGDVLSEQKTTESLTFALSSMIKHEKITHDKMLHAAIQKYPQEYAKELEAIFRFAYHLHHFVQKNFVKFSKEPQISKSLETIYDNGDTLSLLCREPKELFPCFSIAKNRCSFELVSSNKACREIFYDNGNKVEKEVLYELEAFSKALKVTISLQSTPSLHVCMTYPTTTFLTKEQICHLIAWQTLLLKAKVYKAKTLDIESITKQFSSLSL